MSTFSSKAGQAVAVHLDTVIIASVWKGHEAIQETDDFLACLGEWRLQSLAQGIPLFFWEIGTGLRRKTLCFMMTLSLMWQLKLRGSFLRLDGKADGLLITLSCLLASGAKLLFFKRHLETTLESNFNFKVLWSMATLMPAFPPDVFINLNISRGSNGKPPSLTLGSMMALLYRLRVFRTLKLNGHGSMPN